MNALFITIAAILLMWITLWLCRVLWRGVKHDSEIEHHAVNTAVLRDQLLELEQDHANGILTSNDLADAQQELQKRRSEEHTSELQSRGHLVCRLLLEKTK